MSPSSSTGPHVSAIIAAGGRGTRFGSQGLKQLEAVAGVPILQRSVDAFLQCGRVADVTVALPPEVLAEPPGYLVGTRKPLELVAGGERRQDSVARAFARLADRADLIVVHDAARPLVSGSLIERTIEAAAVHGAAIAALKATDTVKRGDETGLVVGTLPRGEIYLAQTPQAFRVDVFRDALRAAASLPEATDEAMLAEHAGHPVRLVTGDPENIKITTSEDLATAERLVGRTSTGPIRIGFGYDLHRLVPGRPLILGGVGIPFDLGLDGHSDADAVCHAVTDAVLGAAAAGEIGRHFPDTDPAWKGADSLTLLEGAAAIVRRAGYAIVNVDTVVIAERPKLAPHIDGMRSNLARALGVADGQVSVKGKTNEGVGATGRGEAIAVHAVALATALNRGDR